MIFKFKRDKNMFAGTEQYLKGIASKQKMMNILEKYGDMGVDLLAEATPTDTGLTADSWHYEIVEEPRNAYKLCFYNDNEVDGVNIAILLQYGHGTRNGGYVVGDDFINPVLSQVAEELSEAVAKEVQY